MPHQTPFAIEQPERRLEALRERKSGTPSAAPSADKETPEIKSLRSMDKIYSLYLLHSNRKVITATGFRNIEWLFYRRAKKRRLPPAEVKAILLNVPL
jgi:hypothetical protein